ncbi:hypothetical protein EDB19DRAFT_1962108 [Suillus lakei]|nr:hypothetical protein EDB19DRAFT_1962108 [Suillus lakei]
MDEVLSRTSNFIWTSVVVTTSSIFATTEITIPPTTSRSVHHRHPNDNDYATVNHLSELLLRPRSLLPPQLHLYPSGGCLATEVTTNFTGQPYQYRCHSTYRASPPSIQSSSSSGSGVHNTGSVVDLSVAGGVAVIKVISLFISKFDRKHFTDWCVF